MALPGPVTIGGEPEERVEREQLAELAVLLRQAPVPPLLAFGDGRTVTLTASLRQLLAEAAAILARGEEVALVPLHTALTTQQAADLLGVSRQYFTRLLDDGALPFQRVGSHRRVIYADVVAYQRQQQRQRRAALRELTRVSEDLGLYDRPD